MNAWKLSNLWAKVTQLSTRLRPARACRALCSPFSVLRSPGRASALLFSVLCSLSWGLAAEEAVTPHDYGPMFYGVELPENGARVLLVIDTSKSMGRKDAARTDGGTRWQTLLDEVAGMTDQMADAIARRRVCYTVTLLYEGGDDPHPGTAPFDLSKPGAADALQAELRAKAFTSGGSFEHTFGETLWSLVSKQHITHVIYLGDNDIGRYGETPARAALTAWYALPRANPTADQRPLFRLKTAWWEPWKGWRRPTARRPVFRSQQRLPPPPRDVVFHAIAIGQKSPFLKEMATLGHGEYVERLPPKRRK